MKIYIFLFCLLAGLTGMVSTSYASTCERVTLEQGAGEEFRFGGGKVSVTILADLVKPAQREQALKLIAEQSQASPNELLASATEALTRRSAISALVLERLQRQNRVIVLGLDVESTDATSRYQSAWYTTAKAYVRTNYKPGNEPTRWDQIAELGVSPLAWLQLKKPEATKQLIASSMQRLNAPLNKWTAKPSSVLEEKFDYIVLTDESTAPSILARLNKICGEDKKVSQPEIPEPAPAARATTSARPSRSNPCGSVNRVSVRHPDSVRIQCKTGRDGKRYAHVRRRR